jgi:hypothetical protein
MASTSNGRVSSSRPKPIRHVYKSGLAGCGGKAAPTAAKNTGAVRILILILYLGGITLLLDLLSL